jgi:hypothetical protein
LGRLERYDKELSKITKAKNLPPEWATPGQRSRAALKALGTGVAEKSEILDGRRQRFVEKENQNQPEIELNALQANCKCTI